MFSDVSCGLKARKFGALERFLSLTDRLAQDPAGLLLDHAGTGFDKPSVFRITSAFIGWL